MDAPEQQNGTARAALKEARAKLRLLEIQAQTQILEAQTHLLESWGYPGYTGTGWGSFVDPTDAMRDPDLWDGAVGGPLPGRRDVFMGSQPGILWPIIRTEMDFDTLRASARVLADVNDLARGVLNRLRNFTIKKGYAYKALPRTPLDREDAKLAVALAPQVQAADNEFCQLNDRVSREKENCIRRIRDGEFAERTFRADPRLVGDRRGLTLTRYVEPEQIRRPMGSPPEWSWGIHTDPDDVETVISYAVEYAGNTDDWEDVPASEVFHSKANVDRTIKRGISDFYCTREGLEGCRKLRRALRTGAAMQASIPWVEQYDTARQAAVAAGVQSAIDQLQPQVQNPFSGKPYNFQQFLPGTVLKVGKGRTYIPGPVAAATNNIHIAIGQYDVRCIGARWDMPEYMISGDASNNNFASILVAGSPFVNAVEAEQDEHVKHNLAVHWAALKNYADAGRFRVGSRVIDFATLKRLIELHCTPPQVAIANKLEEAQVDEIDMRNGVLSKETRREKLGLDNDKEKANIAADPITQTGGQQGGGGSPTSALAGLLGSDPRDKRRPGGSGQGNERDEELESFFLTPREGRLSEVTDANGQAHGNDGKFATSSGSATHTGGSTAKAASIGQAQSDLNAQIHEKLSGPIEHLESTPQGRRTLAKGAELAAKVKTSLKSGVEAALKAADSGSQGGLSLIAGGHVAAGTAQLFSSVFQCVHEEVFEAALAQHSMPGAHAVGMVAAHVAARAETALLQAVSWSWRKLTAQESRQMHESQHTLSDADRQLLDQLGQLAAQALREILREAGIDDAELDASKATKRIAELLGAAQA